MKKILAPAYIAAGCLLATSPLFMWNDSPKGNGELEVVVRDRMTKASVASASVLLADHAIGVHIEQDINANGIVKFTGLPASNNYLLNVRHSRYVQGSYCKEEEKEDCSDLVSVAERGPSKIYVSLRPSGSVSGVVQDPRGEGVSGAIVMVFGSFKGHPGMVIPVMSALTDERGRYRVHSIPPGRYFLAAHRTSTESAVSEGKQSKVIYYPGTTEGAEAQLLDVPMGQDMENISFTLIPESGHDVSGKITNSVESGAVFLHSASLEDKWFPPIAVQQANSDGSFKIHNVPSGDYIIIAQGIVKSHVIKTSQQIQVADSAVFGLTLNLEEAGRLRLVFHDQENSHPIVVSPDVQVSLTPTNLAISDSPEYKATLAVSKTSADIASLFSGRYSLLISGAPDGFSVNEIIYGGRTFQVGDEFAYSASSNSNVEVVLERGARKVVGKVQSDDKPCSRCSVVLLHNNHLITAVKTDENGLYHFSRLAKEDYQVAAFAEDYEPYLLPRNLPLWLSSSQRVNLDHAGELTLNLTPIGNISGIKDHYPTSISIRSDSD
jgi:hypothetical protein